MDIYPFNRKTGLAGVHCAAMQNRLCSAFNISAFQNDSGIFPAKFEKCRFQLVGCSRCNLAARVDAASKIDSIHNIDEIASSRRCARNDIYYGTKFDCVAQYCVNCFNKAGRDFAGFYDHGAARQKCRHSIQKRENQRIVPRRNDANDRVGDKDLQMRNVVAFRLHTFRLQGGDRLVYSTVCYRFERINFHYRQPPTTGIDTECLNQLVFVPGESIGKLPQNLTSVTDL